MIFFLPLFVEGRRDRIRCPKSFCRYKNLDNFLFFFCFFLECQSYQVLSNADRKVDWGDWDWGESSNQLDVSKFGLAFLLHFYCIPDFFILIMTGSEKLRQENQALRNEISDLRGKLEKISKDLAASKVEQVEDGGHVAGREMSPGREQSIEFVSSQ